MKRTHLKERPFWNVKRLRLAAVLLLAAVMLSCLLPRCAAVWNGMLRKAGLVHFAQTLAQKDLYIYVIDVSKADAILIESPGAKLLVDTGTADTAGDVRDYLAARGIDRLDAVWISHGDSDHAGGLSAVSAAVEIGEVVGSAYGALPQQTRTVQPGETAVYGNLTLEVLAPQKEYGESNNNSVVFRLRYGAFSMLFCGDIEAKAEKDLLLSGQDLHADILKAAHHGSDSSTSAELLAAVRPRYAVISTGEDRNGLPRNAVLKRLADAGVTCFRTDRDGTVVIGTDGENIEIITENTGEFFGDGEE